MKHKLRYAGPGPSGYFIMICERCPNYLTVDRKTWYESVVNGHNPFEKLFPSQLIRRRKWAVCRG